MEIVGKIIQILPQQSGISGSTGKAWALQSFVIETLDQYPRKVCIELFGEQRIKDNPLDIDHVVTVSYDLESREFNGRWYTSVRAWKVTNGDQTQQPAQAAQPAPAAPVAQSGGAIYPDKPAAPAAPTVEPFDPNAGGDDPNGDLPF